MPFLRLARAHHPVVRETSLIYPVKREDLLEQVALKHQISSEDVLDRAIRRPT